MQVLPLVQDVCTANANDRRRSAPTNGIFNARFLNARSTNDISQLVSSMASAVQNLLLEGCPIFINRLRSNPKLAERIKKMMQEWTKESEEQDDR